MEKQRDKPERLWGKSNIDGLSDQEVLVFYLLLKGEEDRLRQLDEQLQVLEP